MRKQYTAATLAQILCMDKPPVGQFGLLLDPDTGIPLPGESATAATSSHAPLPFIVQENQRLRPAYMICFDQSYHRRHKLNKDGQGERKRAFLLKHGINSFYYVSHAPFLFMAGNAGTLASVWKRMVSLGIPRNRFEPRDEPLARQES